MRTPNFQRALSSQCVVSSILSTDRMAVRKRSMWDRMGGKMNIFMKRGDEIKIENVAQRKIIKVPMPRYNVHHVYMRDSHSQPPLFSVLLLSATLRLRWPFSLSSQSLPASSRARHRGEQHNKVIKNIKLSYFISLKRRDGVLGLLGREV